MSTPSAASAMSKVSVAEHIAKRNPPAPTKDLIVRATAFFSSETLANPSFRAIASFSATCFRYQSVPANAA